MTGALIENMDEQNALPVATVIRDADGELWHQFMPARMRPVVARSRFKCIAPAYPATVLFRPDQPPDERLF